MEENAIRYKNCLILGNGFDLDLGLKTSYRDFLDSDEWKELCQQTTSSKKNSLITYIDEEHNINNWCDLEEIIKKYAQETKKKKFSRDLAEKIHDEYDLLTSYLMRYLTNCVIHPQNLKEKSFAKTFLNQYIDLSIHDLSISSPTYTFNYTPIDKIPDFFDLKYIPSFKTVHGSIIEKNAILGFECDDFDSIPPELSFMLKANSPYYKSNLLNEDLHKSLNIYIYGHSLNLIDKDYFTRFFSDCLSDKIRRNIYIITYNKDSDVSIRNNIRKMGINLSLLYQCVDMKILHINEISNNDDEKKLSEEILSDI